VTASAADETHWCSARPLLVHGFELVLCDAIRAADDDGSHGAVLISFAENCVDDIEPIIGPDRLTTSGSPSVLGLL